jgi:hypothetical protein
MVLITKIRSAIRITIILPGYGCPANDYPRAWHANDYPRAWHFKSEEEDSLAAVRVQVMLIGTPKFEQFC